MRKLIITAALAATTFTSLSGGFALAATVPCEDIKAQIDDALKTSKPADADQAKFDELMTKGDERCKSEDDRRSDAFYNEALALLGPAAKTEPSTSNQDTSLPAKLGDLSSFKVIVDDTLKNIEAGDMPTAQARITDLESAWDTAQASLKPMDKAGWRAIDVKIDAALSELRASAPDAAKSTAALADLDTSLAASK